MHFHTFIGNVTRDAEMRNTQSGHSVLSFSVAVNNRRTEETTFVDCSLWGKRGSSIEPYMKKGQKVFVQGDFGTREYNGKTYITCNADKVELVGGANRTSNQDAPSDQSYGSPSRQELNDEIPF